MTLQITLTSSNNTIFNLSQKVYICIYTQFGISKIYKSLKSWSAITLNLNKQN